VLVLAAAVGLLLSLYGPAIPELREVFGVGGSGSALVLSAHFAGAMTGIAWWGLERRLAPRTWLRVAVALLVAGAAGVAFAPAWPLVLVAAFGLGVGFGVVVVEINVLFSDGFGERATAMLNLLGASFGAGAVVGPLAVAVSGGYRVPFCAGGLLAVVSLALTRDLPRTARVPAPATERPAFGVVGGFVALCALYVGVESGIGGWEATSLLAGGTGELVAGSLLLAAAGLGLAHVPAFAPAAYTLTGLALGPVFPSALAWLAQTAPGARGSTAMVFAAANLGGVMLPVVIGRLADASSPAVIPTTVLATALACLVAALLLRRSASAASPGTPAAAQPSSPTGPRRPPGGRPPG